MDVSVIIVNYNTKKITSECIESVFDKTVGIDFEVILVDNASTDGSKELFEQDNRIVYLYNKENVGFGRANNIGFNYAKGDFTFLLNSDTILLNNAIKVFYDKISKMPKTVACLGTILLDVDGKPTYSYGAFLSWSTLLPWLDKYDFSEKIPQEGKDVPCVLGADMFIRRSVIDECGFFDPRFFMYNEENDLQRRFRQKGYISKIIEGPLIVHLEGKSNKDSINVRTLEGTFVYMKKWMNGVSYVLFRILFALSRLPRLFSSKWSFSTRCMYFKALIKPVK